MKQAFKLQPEYRDYVWGGQKLRPGQRTAEAWIVYEGDLIASGPLAGQVLGEAAVQDPAGLLGRKVFARTGARFPLLVKLLDCAQWLSVQVHPNDEQAARLEGHGQFGKTEAWHFLQAEPGAQIIGGVLPGTTPEQLKTAIQAGKALLDVSRHIPVQAGQTIYIPAGMLHALGPGILLYEIQQTSTLTYRVYDWDRPASAGRALHTAQSLEVTNPALTGDLLPPPALADGERRVLQSCPYFTLECLRAEQVPLDLHTHLDSFHLLTALEGGARLSGPSWNLELGPLETALVPAAAGAYRLEAQGALKALLAYVQ